MRRLCALLIMICGCVPLNMYRDMETRMRTATKQRDLLSKRNTELHYLLDKCEVYNHQISEKLKAAPVKEQIKQEELDKIKKQALEEAEMKYRLRMKGSKK